MTGRDTFASYKKLLDAIDFKPSRRLGQNFLLDPSLHRVLVDAAAPQPGDLVLEVGPGLGFLTRELAGRSRVVAAEVDSRLHQVLMRELPDYPEGGANVRLQLLDAMAGSRLNPALLEVLAAERQEHAGRFLLVANLPYNIAGPLMAELAASPLPPDEMAVLIQLELAQRLAAQPGTKEYGALSAQLQLAYEPTILRRVGRQVFRPRPQVDSAMLHLRARPAAAAGLASSAERQGLAVFLRQVFGSRRKKLRNAQALAGRALPAELEPLLEQRPDAVAPDDLLSLYLATRIP